MRFHWKTLFWQFRNFIFFDFSKLSHKQRLDKIYESVKSKNRIKKYFSQNFWKQLFWSFEKFLQNSLFDQIREISHISEIEESSGKRFLDNFANQFFQSFLPNTDLTKMWRSIAKSLLMIFFSIFQNFLPNTDLKLRNQWNLKIERKILFENFWNRIFWHFENFMQNSNLVNSHMRIHWKTLFWQFRNDFFFDFLKLSTKHRFDQIDESVKSKNRNEKYFLYNFEIKFFDILTTFCQTPIWSIWWILTWW